MTTARQKKAIGLRAACAALALTLGFLSVQVIFASDRSYVCSMDCCVDAGHCCCSPARPYVEGQASDGGARLDNADVSMRCPEGCASSGYSFNLSLRGASRSAPSQLLLIDGGAQIPEGPPTCPVQIALARACPRAPPAPARLISA